ncbi:nuclear transport factor 2 family protein [Burkholderiaceae bacterium FT117]|uniref:nuclear transport factor 2 family protein n=1 Tax=Zeimonas sediminis TaxID=2944268 RepID=UPI002342F969|nr:nuclear transport factor 2 family protein [Zeimonas sediminis]MCM5570963.1 nuclear transport factor 2 family protein [Zeimonas sediminis]
MHPDPDPGRHEASLARVVAFFESIAPDDAARMDALYADDAWFKDPFNEVRGPQAIGRIFAAMFDQLHEPSFSVRDAIVRDDQAFLTWDFRFRFRRFDTKTPQTIRGATHIRFAPDGRIAMHRDYWDAAEELYEKLPAIGALMRWLKRRAAH